jgi:tRNA(Ile2) C34 agmatinyltransferase TiaS
MALWLPKWLRDEDAPPEIESRRTFIFVGAAAGVVLVANPVQLFDLSDVPKAIAKGPALTLEEMNRIIKELYTPVMTKNLNESRVLVKYGSKVDPECPYCGRGIATNMEKCPRCGAWLRPVDFSLPEDLRDDMEFFSQFTKKES